jgi:hypothetical protein
MQFSVSSLYQSAPTGTIRTERNCIKKAVGAAAFFILHPFYSFSFLTRKAKENTEMAAKCIFVQARDALDGSSHKKPRSELLRGFDTSYLQN